VNPVNISSMCTVFAESEVISLRAQGFDKADIASGLHNSIAQRIVSMVSRLGVKPDLPKKAEWSALVDIAFVGGVAKNRCMQKELEKLLKTKLMVPEEPQITGALGAALIASEEDG
ncbi:MAG: BadF/BadG/BcrA/BcrD ATPase family protein, partial [Methanosarcinales archaeon]